jgi:hypothetical protein
VARLWWSYFDWVVYVAQTRLEQASGARRAALARDVYSYLHLPMVGGIVLFAFGLERVARHWEQTRDRSHLPVGPPVAAIGSLGIVALICVALITYEVMRHREERAIIRGGRRASE